MRVLMFIAVTFAVGVDSQKIQAEDRIENTIDSGVGNMETWELAPNLTVQPTKFKPEWSDLDSRPLPDWYDKAKIGIFLHWGVYSVPSFRSEWFWKYMENDNEIKKFLSKNYRPGFTYQDFAPMFTAEFFDPESWAKLFVNAGAKYVVLTSKHHEGFTLFPSKRSFSWNAVDVGPKRDLVHDVAQAVRKHGIKFGVYHSLYEWYNPIYLLDKNSNFKTQIFPDTKLWPDIKQIIETYKPSVLWSDGDWEATEDYWRSKDLLAWLYNDSPVRDEIVVNDRWGDGVACKHGDFYNCADRFNPQILQKHKWENAFTIDKKSWGHRREMTLENVMTDEEIIHEVVTTVSCGGNALINVGPTKEGTIPLIFQERLLALGNWLRINGEAIYETSPWKVQNDTVNGDVWYTCIKEDNEESFTKTGKETAIYAIFFKWPVDNKLILKDLSTSLHSGMYQVQMLGYPNNLKWSIKSGNASIEIPNQSEVKSKSAWVLKLSDQRVSN